MIHHKDPEAVSYENNYSELLPSFNFGYNITDELLLRVSAAEVMGRASLNELSTQVDDISATWGEFVLHNVGNPNLSPVTAKQADVALEWYFDEGSALTGAIFYKDIDGFVQDWQRKYPEGSDELPVYSRQDFTSGDYIDQPFTVYEPQNLDQAKILGAELGVQYFFDNGFGLTANYTKTDTESYIGGANVGVLPEVPNRFYSFSVLYSTENLSVQMFISHTESYVLSHWSPLNPEGDTTYKSYADPMTWMSLSGSYEMDNGLVFFAEADNVLNENWHSYASTDDVPASYSEWGRKLNLGVRYKF